MNTYEIAAMSRIALILLDWIWGYSIVEDQHHRMVYVNGTNRKSFPRNYLVVPC